MGDQIGLRVFEQEQYKHSKPEGHCLGQFYNVLNVYDWAFFSITVVVDYTSVVWIEFEHHS